MADVLLLHHAQGLTDGVRALADELSGAGHDVRTPDLYAGNTFDDLADGLAYARSVGFDAITAAGAEAADGLPAGFVVIGLSLGVMPAQLLVTRARPDAGGAVLFGSCVPADAFGGSWPAGARLAVHGMDADDIFVGEGDLDAARVLVAEVKDAELFLYPGTGHLAVDSSLADYDEPATRQFTARVLAFLAAAG